MNLPTHIITCSPPSMNLPTHGITSPDPSIASLRKTTHIEAIDNNITTWRNLSAARRNVPRLLGGTSLAARCQVITNPLFWSLPPGRPHSAARRHAWQKPLVLLSLGAHVPATRCYIISIPAAVFTPQTRLSHNPLTPPRYQCTLIHQSLILGSLALHKWFHYL